MRPLKAQLGRKRLCPFQEGCISGVQEDRLSDLSTSKGLSTKGEERLQVAQRDGMPQGEKVAIGTMLEAECD